MALSSKCIIANSACMIPGMTCNTSIQRAQGSQVSVCQVSRVLRNSCHIAVEIHTATAGCMLRNVDNIFCTVGRNNLHFVLERCTDRLEILHSP